MPYVELDENENPTINVGKMHQANAPIPYINIAIETNKMLVGYRSGYLDKKILLNCDIHLGMVTDVVLDIR